MSNQSAIEVLLSDPLGKTARQERNRLLLSSLVGLAVAKAHIIPTKINSLGIDFSGANQRAFVFLLASAVLYFLVAFAIYGLMDVLLVFATARKLHQEAYRREEGRQYPNLPTAYFGSIPLLFFAIRAIMFDFLFPCALGIAAVAFLFKTY